MKLKVEFPTYVKTIQFFTYSRKDRVSSHTSSRFCSHSLITLISCRLLKDVDMIFTSPSSWSFHPTSVKHFPEYMV